jgi:hypothetical protein
MPNEKSKKQLIREEAERILKTLRKVKADIEVLEGAMYVILDLAEHKKYERE